MYLSDRNEKLLLSAKGQSAAGFIGGPGGWKSQDFPIIGLWREGYP